MLLFAGQFVIAEALLRLVKGSWDALPLAIGVAGSVPVWWLAATLAKRSALRYPVALVASALLVCQSAFFLRYGYFLDRQVLTVAAAQRRELWLVLGPALPWLCAGAALMTVLQAAMLRASRGVRAPRSWAALGLAPALASALTLPMRNGTADLRITDSLAALTETPAEARSPEPVVVAPLRSVKPTLPNVVLVLTESVRADSYCSSPTPGCPFNPRVNALLPDRVGLTNLRSLASFTTLSLSTLITGRSQVAPAAEVVAMPTLFEYAKAVVAGDMPPFTAYWSAHFAPVFARKDLHDVVDSFVTFEDLTGPGDSYEEIDARLLEHFKRHYGELPEPFFLVLHFYETHVPYFFEDDDAPFAPWSRQVTWATLPGLFNAYRNAIHTQDKRVAEALSAVVSDPRGSRTLLLFTSDHGDEFDEHHQIHHGQDLFDEQIRVPGWVRWGEDVLAEGEAAAVRDNAARFLTHLDVAPTILDVYGVWDADALAPHRRAMHGRSLLRSITLPMAPVPISNCTEVAPCPLSTWGVLGEGRKLTATAWDPAWQCLDVGVDGERPLPRGDAGCEGLSEIARERFPRLPNGAPNW